MAKPLFITFEGVEGSGKSTQLQLTAEWLKHKGAAVYCTREPGGTAIGIEIRKILLSEKNSSLAPFTEALLYLADRFQHLKEVIRPRLSAGEIVLCDRYHDSTIAYQGYARKIPLQLLNDIWALSDLALEPDYTFLFDLDPATGIKRSLSKLASGNVDESRFEKETLDFHRKVREGFLALAETNPRRIFVINATRPVEDIQLEVVRHLERWLTS